MVRLSYARSLCARSAWTGPAALAAFLCLVVPWPSAGSPTRRPGNPRTVITTVVHPALAAPADTDWSVDTLPVNSGANSAANRRSGYVITEEQLDLEQEYPLSSVLVAHIPGIHVVHGAMVSRVASGIHLDLNGSPCYVQMFIDGVFVADGDVDMVSVRDVASIEYRTPGNIPVQYQNRLQGAPCGALFLWSKS